MALAVVPALWIGCGSEEPAPAPPVSASDATSLPPELIRTALDGLKSNNPRVQYASLDRLASYPEVVRTYREHVERLQREGRDEKIRQKAAELLAAVTSGEEAEQAGE